MQTIVGQLMMAVQAAGDDKGNLVVGLLIGAFALVAGIWWFVHRFRVARRPAASRAEHEMLREIHGERPEQKAVNDQTTVKYLRRGGL
ncbi:hypothetical protein [Arthrobacter sp.]|uniref:hypothetical protein n=1 Tax=Arthrobacter sp. TaxID=1667 RepID=UPI003A8DB660